MLKFFPPLYTLIMPRIARLDVASTLQYAIAGGIGKEIFFLTPGTGDPFFDPYLQFITEDGDGLFGLGGHEQSCSLCETFSVWP